VSRARFSTLALVALLAGTLPNTVAVAAPNLPARYYKLLSTGAARIEERLATEPAADLRTLESAAGWRHFPATLLVAAVLYTQGHPANPRQSDAKLLALAQRIGDLLVSEHTEGRYTTRLDHHRDTYMWLEAYRLLEGELGEARRGRWRGALLDLLARLAADVAEKQDYPWYQSPFISTSPNHYALWAKTVYLGGEVCHNDAWERLGARVLHRFATEEQAPDYHHQMSVPAGIRKRGPWVTCLSGLIATPTTSQWYLDRQGHLSLFHQKLGLIVTGANSKHQPGLATFTEKTGGDVVHVPTSTRLTMSDHADQLALAYNSFFAVLEVMPASDQRQEFRFLITPTGRLAEVDLNLQLVLQPGEALETAANRRVLVDEKPIRWSAEEVGHWLRHRGWTLKLPPGARLAWPVYPFNPYRNGPETALAHAVATLFFTVDGSRTFPFAAEADE